LNIDFVGSDGWISARNEHADFEMWSRLPVTIEPIRRQLPNPKRPRSSQQAVIEGLVNNLDEGTVPLCPGEYGREALEIAIGLREPNRRGGEKIELPLCGSQLDDDGVDAVGGRRFLRFPLGL
jgi:hypothetical protein